MQALFSGLGSPHSPGIFVCLDHTRCEEDRKRRHRPPWIGDQLALGTRSVQEAFENFPDTSSFRTGMGGSGDVTASLFLPPPHLSPCQEGAELTTRQNFLDEGGMLLPGSWYSQNWVFVSSNALSFLLSPLLSYCPMWLLASQVSPSLVRDKFYSNVFHLNHHEKKYQKDDFVSMLNHSQKKQGPPTFHQFS